MGLGLQHKAQGRKFTLIMGLMCEQERRPPSQCSMRGKRLPELVAGDLRSQLHGLMTQEATAIEMGMSLSLSPEQKLAAVQDWEAGRAHLLYLLDAKLDWTSKLPWSLAGLAHHDPVVWRKTCQDALQTWDGAEHAGYQRVTAMFCEAGSPLRAALETCALTGVVTPELELASAKLAIVDISERKAEAPHAIVKFRKGF